VFAPEGKLRAEILTSRRQAYSGKSGVSDDDSDVTPGQAHRPGRPVRKGVSCHFVREGIRTRTSGVCCGADLQVPGSKSGPVAIDGPRSAQRAQTAKNLRKPLDVPNQFTGAPQRRSRKQRQRFDGGLEPTLRRRRSTGPSRLAVSGLRGDCIHQFLLVHGYVPVEVVMMSSP
jgi:hypothetical protein